MPATKHATLYVRASIPNRIREHVYGVVDDLEALEAEGAVDEVTVETWDARVPVDGGEDRLHARAHDAYDEFSAWADEAGRSLDPYFRVRETARGEVLVLPIMCLAVEGEDGLEAVYPSETDAEKATVLDGVADLEAERPIAAE